MVASVSQKSFPFSLRIDGWDPQTMDPEDILRERDAFDAAGVQHVVAAPIQKDRESWLRSVELLAQLLELKPR
jgi:hypothetical protein